MFHSVDGGKSWSALPGQVGRWPVSLALDPQGRLLVGTNGHGLYRTSVP